MNSIIKNIQRVVKYIEKKKDDINDLKLTLKLKRLERRRESEINNMSEKFSELISLPDEKYYTNFEKKDVTILLQGILNKDIDIFQTIELYSLSGHIVLSVYDDEYTKNICNQILKLYPTDVSVVYNNLETYKREYEEIKKNYNDPTLNNFYFQLKTTISGLENIQTKYILKSRVDHYYSDIDKFIAHGIISKKIISSSLYVRGLFDKKYPKAYFHMSDLLFFGETIKIKEMLYLSQEMCFTPSMMGNGCEVRVWKPYLITLAKLEGLNIDDTNIKHGEDYEYMMKYVQFLNSKINIYPVNLHDNFKIKLGKNNVIHTKNDKQPNNTSFYYFIKGIGDTKENIIKFKDTTLYIVIHVGKCSGTAIKKSLKHYNIHYNVIHHANQLNPTPINYKSIINKNNTCKFIFCIRHPIDRMISAFNFKYTRTILLNGNDHFNDEKTGFNHFKTIQDLAENLYNDDGIINEKANNFCLSCDHIIYGLHHYLNNFNKDHDIRIIRHEYLKEDYKNIFNKDIYLIANNYQPNFISNFNSRVRISDNIKITKKAYNNLKLFLKKDYDIIEQLSKYNLIPTDYKDFCINELPQHITLIED